MGYALLFARQLSNTARKNRLNYEIMSVQNRKNDITSQMAIIQGYIDQMPKDSQTAPFLEFQKQMLAQTMSFLDSRIATLQAQAQKAAAEEQPIAEALNAQIQASAPKYVV